MKVARLAALALLAAGLLAASGALAQYRILHVMSFHTPFTWSDDQYAGFREALAGVAVEYRVFRMDAQRNRSSPGWGEAQGKKARALIDEWKPDLVYASDDEAQEHVTRHYVGKDLPFVFSGVDREPETYGFVGARNITGVPETLHVVATLRLLQAVAPGTRRILLISDNGAHWPDVVARIRKQAAEVADVEIVGWKVVASFEAYQRAVTEAAGKADALWPLGLSFKDAGGRGVSMVQAMKWTTENSRLPDLALWDTPVRTGVLLAVTVSGREQGLAAGRLARAILVDGRSPASLPMVPAGKGVPMINLARANKLGLKIRSSVLLSAEVLDKFDWEPR
jgi:ABC-type uncharacterized transport system substrate-binding protein